MNNMNLDTIFVAELSSNLSFFSSFREFYPIILLVPYLRLILGMRDGKFTFKLIYLGLHLPRLQREVL
ncbi:hypothetical protein ARMGADRAFT_1108039 [Armillaria gallica]|uniref:Uncharacterized protein n=1 Tax=Armillaria gallica TaxID=47427 RepID=A0A2H3E6I6_ARMGA|nr:hypothetical protein ARMGADRAFT_1108039 [Armillaria gallica]